MATALQHTHHPCSSRLLQHHPQLLCRPHSSNRSSSQRLLQQQQQQQCPRHSSLQAVLQQVGHPWVGHLPLEHLLLPGLGSGLWHHPPCNR